MEIYKYARYARFVMGGKSVSVVAKTFNQIGFIVEHIIQRKTIVNDHVITIQRKEAEKLRTESDLGTEVYKENVAQNAHKGKNLSKLDREDKEGVRVKINTMHQIIKNNEPFTD